MYNYRVFNGKGEPKRFVYVDSPIDNIQMRNWSSVYYSTLEDDLGLDVSTILAAPFIWVDFF